jgi:hypothetical protein
MPLEPFNNIGIKPDSKLPLDGAIKFANHGSITKKSGNN